MPMSEHFRELADYNCWANRRLYADAASLSPADWQRHVGIFFGSLHGTLNHLLLADRIWMRRLTGIGEHPDRLDAILYDDPAELALAREAEDARILGFTDGLDETALEDAIAYTTTAGRPHRQKRSDILAHLFNHQTHHRGQAHAALTILGISEPAPLDLLVRQRERAERARTMPAPDQNVRSPDERPMR